MAEPGETPTFPATVESVQVTAVPARIAKLAAVPSEEADAADEAPIVLRDSSDEGREEEDRVDEVPHARAESRVTSGTRRANRALRSICVLQAGGWPDSEG